MYLERRSIHDLPKDAVVVSEKEALDYYYKHIYGTKFKKEVWPLKYGLGLTGLVSVATSYSLISYYKSRVRLGTTSFVILSLSCSLAPAALSIIIHNTYIQPEIILQKACSSCTIIRSIMYQNLFAVVYPVVPGALLSFLFAISHESYPVPGFMTKADIIDTAKLYMKFTQRAYPKILLCVLLNSITAWYITSQEFNSFEALNRRLQEQDQKLRELVSQYETSK